MKKARFAFFGFLSEENGQILMIMDSYNLRLFNIRIFKQESYWDSNTIWKSILVKRLII